MFDSTSRGPYAGPAVDMHLPAAATAVEVSE